MELLSRLETDCDWRRRSHALGRQVDRDWAALVSVAARLARTLAAARLRRLLLLRDLLSAEAQARLADCVLTGAATAAGMTCFQA